MKHNLFDWDDREDGDGETSYNDVCLRVAIGQFPVGTRFDAAYINYRGSEESEGYPYLHLINYVEGVHGTRKCLYMGTYALTFAIEEIIDEPQ